MKNVIIVDEVDLSKVTSELKQIYMSIDLMNFTQDDEVISIKGVDGRYMVPLKYEHCCMEQMSDFLKSKMSSFDKGGDSNWFPAPQNS